MKLSEYLAANKISQKQFATKLGVTQGLIHQWISGLTAVSPQKAVLIERMTDGSVTRKDTHPDDWQLIWPELEQQPAAA